MSMPIVAVIMVKNEDLYIRKVIEGIQHFVSDIIMIDNCSTDETVSIAKHCGVQPITEPDLRVTHGYIEPYVGRGVWVFGVDGDEIYDAAGLERLHDQMVDGLYDDAYQVQGWYLHATEFAPGRLTAKGYLGPPAHTPAKLYNMDMIDSWPNTYKDILFMMRKSTRGRKARALPDTWEGTPMRCVHTRFLRRSSQEPEETVGVREEGRAAIGIKIGSSIAGNELGKNKRLNYRRGEVREVQVWPM